MWLKLFSPRVKQVEFLEVKSKDNSLISVLCGNVTLFILAIVLMSESSNDGKVDVVV